MKKIIILIVIISIFLAGFYYYKNDRTKIILDDIPSRTEPMGL